jgi:cyclase
MKITSNVYAETEYRGANVGFITTDCGILMVDSPMRPTDATNWTQKLTGIDRIKYLVNTEPHIDHVAGNFFFPESTIIAQRDTRDEVLEITHDQMMSHLAKVDPVGSSLMTGYRINVPSITFSERLTLFMGSHTCELIHLPGHTQGQTAVFMPEEKVVFTGDNVFCRVQTWLYEGDPFAWLESLKIIGDMDVDFIVPGHGEVCDKTYLAEQAAFLQEWIDVVGRAVTAGWTLEESVARISLLDRYPMAQGLDALGPEVQRKNVAHMYGILTALQP